jgi:hypothetical protein
LGQIAQDNDFDLSQVVERSPDEVLLIDEQALHERVLNERLPTRPQAVHLRRSGT